MHAIQGDFVVLSRDKTDYANLHDLIVLAGGKHCGILMIRSEKAKSKDMRPHEIVNAISKLESSAVPLGNQIIVLNQWR